MICALCIAYQGRLIDINKQGFHRKYCEGCIPRGEGCLHMGDTCDKLKNKLVRFCYECGDFPCKRLRSLDKRYRTKYRMSMIDNLRFIDENGIDAFLEKENAEWACPDCGATICCHNGLCLKCGLDKLLSNRKYRWGEE
ncbi:MAG: DUF3795 domain-containing protein [Clostridia bacterium]|nr:DUF3795 domain-containing protein [Clostridia bacterium]